METRGRRVAADPLEEAPPAFSSEEAAAAARRLFGLAGDFSTLDSERDQNLRVDSDDGRRYLLKISNPADGVSVIEMQTEALLHINRQDPGLPVMRPLPTLDGDLYASLEGGNGDRHLIRLFTWVEGRMFSSTDLDSRAMEGFGVLVARMGLALRGFFHPAAGYRILWDLKHTADLRPFAGLVTDERRRDICDRVLARFEGFVMGSIQGLRAQPIHNDLTLDNVLLDDAHAVSGIVDFGDLTHTALICDLAIALVSLMWGRPDPFEAAEAAIAGYRTRLPIDPGEADLLGDLVTARLLALVLIANRRVTRYPENAAYIMANVEAAWELLEGIEVLGYAQFGRRLRDACLKDPPAAARSYARTEELLERRRRVLGPALSPLSYDRPLHIVRAEGAWMFDDSGNSYLDAYNNVPVVGHGHPRITRVIAEQSRLLNTNTRYLHHSVIELAERLVATMPAELDTVMFVNSGSEANDIAWRFATAYTGATGAIVTANAYHGVTAATLALSPEAWSRGESPAHVETVPAPDGYRGAYRSTEPGWAEPYVRHLGAAIARMQSRGNEPAAFYFDSLFTSDGIFAPPPSYLQQCVDLVHEAGGLVVADEVQSGFGRSGEGLWSFQTSEVIPDFVTLGKPMGNGHPVAAIVTRSEIVERFASGSDIFSTFGGNPVATRAGLAVLDVIEEEKLQEQARTVGDYLRAELKALVQRHASIGDVRGRGLMLGVELASDDNERRPLGRLAHLVMNCMKDKGVLVGTTGPHGNVLKIRPPLVLTTRQAGLIVEALDGALGSAPERQG